MIPEDLSPVLAHLESCYPNEGCGLIIRDSRGQFRIRPMVNVYDRYHEVDPVAYPRTSRTAYLFNPKEWLTVSEEAAAGAEAIVCVFHSHCDVGAYFSAEDKIMAAPEGAPLLPETEYLVVAVDAGKTTNLKLFAWEAGDFRERPIKKPSSTTPLI